MSGPRQSERRVRRFLPDAALALVWAGFGMWSAAANSSVTAAVAAIVILTSVGVGLSRHAPAAALAAVWAAGVVQVLSVSDVLGAQAGVLVVAYATARYGRWPTVWLGGLSVVAGAALSEYYVFGHSTVLPSAIDIATPLLRHTGVGVTSAFLLGVAGLGIPWALGLAVRFNVRYREAAADRERAQALAAEAEVNGQLRSEQVRLARDVHDLVGHSLAVIIAQADAALIRADERDDPVRVALENIAAVARSSLGEVRQVLQDTRERTSSGTPSPDLNALVDRSRAAGHDVLESTRGEPVDLAPETQATVYRVLQEMLTNAIKHGQPGRRIGLVHTWAATSYTLSVTNVPRLNTDQTLTTDPHGMGVDGMRGRLAQIDGTLVLSRPEDAGSTAFTATARIPLAEQRSNR